MGGYEKITGEKIPNTLFPFFWQHGEEHEVLGEYIEKISQCGMKGVCIEARPHPDFVGEGWWSDMDFLVRKATELGMEMWILDDSHFPTGYANGRIRKEYPQYLKKYLDQRRFDIQGPLRGARIDLRILGKRAAQKKEQGEILGVYLAGRENGWDRQGDPILAETLRDITMQVDKEKRLLTLDVPEGAWSIFIVYLTRESGEEATKDYLNPLIKEATQVLVDEVYEAHYRRYREEFGKTIRGFFSDEPRFGNARGTEARIGSDMALPWRDGLEEELGFETRLLPLLWTPASGEEREVRRRYMDTITRMYSENFTQVIGNWCRQHGVVYVGHTIEDNGAHTRLGYGTGHFFRGQQGMDIAGIDEIGGQIVPGMNYHHDSYRTGGSNGEFYHYALAKLGSSAAHLDPGKKGRAMCEAFGLYGWNEGLKMMKWITDHLTVRGINWFVPHAFDPKEFPDADCPPHFYAHGHNPQFRYFNIFTSYVNRMAGLFRDGRYPAAVGVYYPAETEWMGECMAVEKPARVLTQNQISFDIVSLDYLKEAEVSEGAYSINGQRFQVLVLPWAEIYPEELTGLTEKFAEAGIRVLFLGENRQGIKGERTTLEKLGDVLSDFKGISCEEAQPDLVLGEYERAGKRYYMLFNENTGTPVYTKARLSTQGKVYRYDAFSDRLYPVGHEVMVRLEPYESAVFIVSSKEIGCSGMTKADGLLFGGAEEEKGWEKRRLPDIWSVKYADSFTYPEWSDVLPVDSLCCVQETEGWEERTGTLRYETKISAEENEGSVLDLGTVYETAEVFVNGNSAGVRLCPPYRFDLTGMLREGENELAVEVTNTLGTSVRDAVSSYQAIEPFGVEGPAQLYVYRK
ncbi:MAG TPA: glycoside hydrolase [Candidatus Mediterraneibacter norfolkensis]|nr:glycoside hydrolase [Candidatus Mediterraneibacter norfolkensis]